MDARVLVVVLGDACAQAWDDAGRVFVCRDDAVFGSRFRVGEHKGKVEEAEFGQWRGLVVGTIHPSAVLRGEDPAAREAAYAGLVADLGTAREACRAAS